jgi:hypothetical protein
MFFYAKREKYLLPWVAIIAINAGWPADGAGGIGRKMKMSNKTPAAIAHEIAVTAAKDAFNASGACMHITYAAAIAKADAEYRAAIIAARKAA